MNTFNNDAHGECEGDNVNSNKDLVQERIDAVDGPAHSFPMPLSQVFEIGVQFLNEKDGSQAVKLSYQDRLQLISYMKQVKHGKCPLHLMNNIGSLDFIGADRIRSWNALGEMSKEDSMKRFIDLLCKRCPLFILYVEAQCLAGSRENNEVKQERTDPEEESALKLTRVCNEDEEKKQIREALDQQTYPHFKLYAEQQHPGDLTAQEQLIRQLQDEHFNQYMNHVYKQQRLHQIQQAEQLRALKAASKPTESAAEVESSRCELFNSDKENVDDEYPPLIAASMWTRKEIVEFKDQLRNESESVLHVSSGETVTVRVPTHEQGRFIYWEFASDHYDIGFGVYFEWSISPNNLVTIHISDSSDDDEEEVNVVFGSKSASVILD